jgi:hypothetical protein
MISQKSQLETKINDKDHTFQCHSNAPLMECLQALDIFRSYIYGRIKEVEEQAKAQAEAQANPAVTDEVKQEPIPQ